MENKEYLVEIKNIMEAIQIQSKEFAKKVDVNADQINQHSKAIEMLIEEMKLQEQVLENIVARLG